MKKKTSRLRRTLRFFLWLAAFGALAGILGIAGLFAYVARDLPSPEAFAERRIAESTKIYDRTGTVLLYDIHGEEKRTVISPEEIPGVVKQATIAIEDANFYNHIGIEPKAILRAVYANLRKRRISQGGSTITQQLILNTLISRYTERGKRTVFRKAKDMILAIELERKYPKDQILGFYLNQIPYGANAYGVEAASQTYFGKPAKALSVAEAAALVALPKAPTYYSPYGSHKEELLARKDLVLGRMRTLGFLSEEAFDSAKNEKLVFIPNRQEIRAPHFVFYVREILEEFYGDRYLEEGGLRIITSLDWDLQQKAEELVQKHAFKNEKSYKAANAALSAVDPVTGDVLAMVGSRDYFDEKVDGNVNVATRLRQPGSSFKPIVYATAFAKGFTPQTILFDLETNFGSDGAKEYIPKNYDGEFRGPVSLRQALAQSLNVPSVKTLYLAGIDNAIETAERLGITSLKDRSRYGLSLVLGGGEVTLLEETGAYAAFAADGLFRALRPILAIKDLSGRTLRDYPVEEKRAVDAEVSRLVTDILADNEARAPMFGLASALTLGSDIPVAAKTGTTQENHDAWVLGYTTALAAGVWVGNNDNTPMTEKGAGISAAGPLWNEFMVFASKTYAAEPFPEPQISIAGKAVLDGKLGEETAVTLNALTGKRATEFTPLHLRESRTYTTVHTLLASVDKNNPRGPAPVNPEEDFQYWNWEHPIEQWVIEQNVAGAQYNKQPPEEYDTVYTTSSQPRVFLRLSAADGVIRDRAVALAAETDGANIARVEFYFDAFYAGSDHVPPFSLAYVLPDRVKGREHAFTARAYDDAGNTAADSRAVTIDPASGVSIEDADGEGE